MIKPAIILSTSILHTLAVLVGVNVVGAFSPASVSPFRQCHQLSAASVDVEVEEWTSLTEDGGVKMRVISTPKVEDAIELLDLKGKDVTVEYIGSIAPRNWSVNDIIDCWLPDQGLTSLAPELFKAFEIDGEKLTGERFSKKFIFEGLGILKEAKINNLHEAAQDLKLSETTHLEGTVFDKNQFTFRLGKGMSIKAFDLAIKEMKKGQTATVVARCDYAYGSRGLRAMGKFLIPPYATVQYEATLVEIK